MARAPILGPFWRNCSWIYSEGGYIQSVNVGGILDIGTEGKGEEDHRGQENQRGKMHWGCVQRDGVVGKL